MRLPLLIVAGLFLLDACSSGKAALKKGDYYDAVLESVHRLRSSPDNKKAKAVLEQGYPLAIDYIDTNIQNGIAADDPHKWRNAVKGYEQINYLNDQIKTSLGAMKVITKPVARFKELADAKQKAADESYTAGINALMKNTREDAKTAYFDFKTANEYEPGFRESIEMMTQAEFNATLRVAYEEINTTRYNYGTMIPIITSMQREFLSFKSISQKDTVPPHQTLRLVFNGYQSEPRPTFTSSNEEVKRDVKVGEKKGADGKTVDVMQSVTAKVTYYKKTKRSFSEATITITEAASGGILQNERVQGVGLWQNDWATYSGDVRALTTAQQSLIKRSDVNPNDNQLYDLAMQNMKDKVSQGLSQFYSKY